MIRVVAEGRWTYDDAVIQAVRVIETDFDFWFEVGRANGDLQPGETSALNGDGRLYYILYGDKPVDGTATFWPDSIGWDSLAAARSAAERQLPSEISWSPVAST